MSDAVRICIADVSPLADAAVFAAAYEKVTAERRARADRYRFPRDKYLSLGAELLLRRALCELGVAMPPSLSRTEYGKPYIPDCPVHFSLSHSGIYAMCAAAARPVGCDVERITADDLPLAERWLAPDERAAVMAKPAERERAAEFSRLWTRKESYVKLIGTGLETVFASFSVFDIAAAGEYSFAGHDGADGYSFAVCAAGDLSAAKFDFYDIRDIL